MQNRPSPNRAYNCMSAVIIYKYFAIVNKLETHSGNFSVGPTDGYKAQYWVTKSFSRIPEISECLNYKSARQNYCSPVAMNVEKLSAV